MNRPRPFHWLLFTGALLLLRERSLAQCQNEIQYPDFAVTPSIVGAPTQISDCVVQENYSRIDGIVAGASYKFVTDHGSYITVRQDTYDGAVLGAGYSPVIVVAATAGDLFPHYTVDDQCEQSFDCLLATVQAFLTCQPPLATVVPLDDCPSNSFTITVNVASTGDAPTVTLEYDVNDGPPVSIPGIGAGEFVLGPFTIGDVVDVLVAHESDPACNQAFNDIVSEGNCPYIIDCAGPGLTLSYCYANDDAHHWTFQSSGGQAMQLSFSGGSIESVDYDQLTIYNGPDDTYPVLYQHDVFEQVDLGGISVVGGPTLYMEMASDGFGSCDDGNMSQWTWSIHCLDCFPPTVAFAVQTDCASGQFTVDVNVTDMGNDPVLDIGNDGGAPVVNVPGPGLYTVGPFALNTPVVVTVVNDLNDLCSVASGPLVNTVCPFISCGPDQYAYCYANDDHTYWVYQSNNGQPIGLEFLSGSLYPWDGDAIRVYDGLDQSGAVLYDGNNNGDDLGGMQWISTNPDNALTLEVSSDHFSSCSTMDATEWHYVVACYDGCSEPAATFSPVTDCAGSSFSVEVTLADLGGAPALTISNDGGAAPVLANGPGTYTCGPFTLDVPVVITLESTSALCNLYSAPLLNPVCPDTIVCGEPALELSYCYTNNDSHAWHWVSDGTEPLALVFSSGTLESMDYDHLAIYDGASDQAPVLYEHTGFDQEDLTGLLVTSTGTHLYMEMSSDEFFSSCDDGEQQEWNWTVGCLDCTNPVADFQVVPDCVHNSFNVAVTVSSLGTASALRLQNSLDGTTLDDVGLGTTLFGPFPLDSTTTVGVYNAANALCRVFSAPMTYSTQDCVVPSCAAAAYEHCYTDSDTAWFMYESSEGLPITIGFLWGELLVNDYVQIYNGIGINGTQLIHMG
ncbi:MAG: hypothetical protein JST66_03860, partial [Bacteroidetes bacterium]|nr:hypothetical protein [Bacteroidota bacterium]